MIATLGDNRLKKVKVIFQYSKGVVDFAVPCLLVRVSAFGPVLAGQQAIPSGKVLGDVR